MKAPVLRDYQEAALNAIAAARVAGQNRLLMKMPTGGGKTIVFAQMLRWPALKLWLDTLPSTGAKLLVIAHREELLTQAQAKIQAANPGLMVSIEQGEARASRYSDVIVASIQTLSARKFRRLQGLLRHHTFRIVVIDEAHHAAAASYRTALVYLGFLPPADASATENLEAVTHDDVDVMTRALEGWDLVAPKDRLLVGVTATPNRTDAIGLSCVFQTIAYSYGLKEAIDDEWLVPIVPWVVETTTSLDDVRITAGEFNQKDLGQTVNTPQRNALAVESWATYAKGRPTLAFTVDVAHAFALADTFHRAGVKAYAISGETPKYERKDILAAFMRGEVDVICNCMILTEGTDLPLCSAILHAKPTKSATLYEQMSGRGLRIHPGKTDCVIIDIVDIARRHSLQAAPVLYGLPPGVKTTGQDLRVVSDDLDAFREKYPNFDIDGEFEKGHYTIGQLAVIASTFNVWDIPSLGALAQVVTLDWIKSSDDTFRLSFPWADGTETVSVQPDVLGHFNVSTTLRPREKGSAVRQRTVAAQIGTAVEALVLAEQFVINERHTVLKLKDREAPWRGRPASDKQIAYLHKLRVSFNPRTVTCGEASSLIDLAHARKAR